MARTSSKRKTSSQGSDKPKKPTWHVAHPPKCVVWNAEAMHPIHQQAMAQVRTAVDAHGGAYLEAATGSGKTTHIPALFLSCTAEGAVLNMVVMPSVALIDEMAPHIPTSVPPPLSPFGDAAKESALRGLLDNAQPGETVAVMVTHDFLRKKLKPTKMYPYHDLKLFLRDVGKPATLNLLIDEGHHFCANPEWGELLATARSKTNVRLVLVSATSKLDKPKQLAAAAGMLGVAPAVLKEEARVSLTPADVEQFKRDTSVLPLPDPGWNTSVTLARAYPNDGLATLLHEPLKDLGMLLVGDFLYKLARHLCGQNPRKEIHAARAMDNLIADINATIAHHGPAGEPNGGALFAVLQASVKTTKVKGGKVDGKVLKAKESVLVAHARGRGAKTHARLLEELPPDANGVPAFAVTDLSLAQSNAAKQGANHAAFVEGFQSQASGMQLGVLTPKQMEGTSKYAAIATAIVVVGGMRKEPMAQARRTDRPVSPQDLLAMEGRRVRLDKTAMVHLDSPWGNAVATMEHLGKAPNILSAPPDVYQALKQKLDALQGKEEYDAKAIDLVVKMTMALLAVEGKAGGAPLLPGRLCDMFLTYIEDEEACAAFMKRAATDDDEHGDYWRIVDKWMCDEDDFDEASTDEEGEA